MNDSSEPFFSLPTRLSDATVSIIGLGLIGGSLALALRGHCRKLIAVDSDPATRQLARQFRVVDEILEKLEEALPKTDILILATPVGSILSIIEQLKEFDEDTMVVIDVGSTKVQITKALESLPGNYDPIGGHPMCGKETAGLGSADPGIFRGARFAFSQLKRTTHRAKNFAEQITQITGAYPLWVDPVTHDRWVAATSHLPYLVSTALTLSTPEDAAPLVGPGFKSSSRLSGSHPNMMFDILMTNREAILQALERFKGSLLHLERQLCLDEAEGLKQSMGEARAQRNVFVDGIKK